MILKEDEPPFTFQGLQHVHHFKEQGCSESETINQLIDNKFILGNHSNCNHDVMGGHKLPMSRKRHEEKCCECRKLRKIGRNLMFTEIILHAVSSNGNAICK